MTTWSKERQELERMRMQVIMASYSQGNTDRAADQLIATLDHKIYLQEQRDGQGMKNDDELTEPTHTPTPDDEELDTLRAVKIGSRTTTFRIGGRSVSFGEFRRAAKNKGVDLERRLKLDNKPERFISRGDVRAEP